MEPQPSERRKHIASPFCWCDPVLIEPGVYLHHDIEFTTGSDTEDGDQPLTTPRSGVQP